MLISSAFIWIATVLAQVQPGPVGEEKHLSKPKFLIPVSLQPDKVAELQGFAWKDKAGGRRFPLPG